MKLNNPFNTSIVVAQVSFFLAIVGCSSNDLAPGKALVKGPADGSTLTSPTEVGNGANGGSYFESANLGVKVPYDSDKWKLTQRMDEKVGLEKVDFTSKTSEDTKVSLEMGKHHMRNTTDYLGQWNVKTQTPNETIRIAELDGIILQKEPMAKIILANSEIAIKVVANSIETIRELLAKITYTNPECSRFEVGQTVTYVGSNHQSGKTQRVRLTVVDKILTEGKVLVRREPGDKTPIAIACRYIDQTQSIRNLFSAEDSSIAKSKVTLEVPVETKTGQKLTVKLEEDVITKIYDVSSRPYKRVTYFLDSVPVFGVLQQETRSMDGKVLEVWKLESAGKVNIPVADMAPLNLANSVSQADQMILDNLKNQSVAYQIFAAERFLEASKPRLAYQAYAEILATEKSMKAANIDQLSKAYFGRAFSHILVLTERADYQDIIHKMGFDSYIGSNQFFGPLGFLAHFSLIEEGICASEKIQMSKRGVSDLPFEGLECQSKGWQIFGRSMLTSADYREAVRPLIEDLGQIVSDIDLAVKNPDLIFHVPASIHFGNRSYTFYLLEAKVLSAGFRSMKAGLEAVLAYDSINFPVGNWFGKNWTGSKKSREYRKHIELFRDEFNRGFLKLVDATQMLAAKDDADKSASDWEEALALADKNDRMSNFVSTPAQKKTIELFIPRLKEFHQSILNGEVKMTSMVRQPVINFKRGLEVPFDTAQSDKIPLVIVEDFQTEEPGFKMNKPYLKDWAKSFSVDYQKLGQSGVAWSGGHRKDFEGVGSLYGPLDFAKHVLIRGAQKSK